MDNRKFQAAAAAGAPTAPASPSSGYPTNGNPGTGTPATLPGEWWFHQIGEELRGVITAAGLTPSHTNLTQLLGALTAGWGMGKLLANPGYVTLPGGVIVQWGDFLSVNTGATFPLAFPNSLVKAFIFPNQNNVSSVIGNTIFISASTNSGLTRGASGISAFYLAIGY